MKQPNKTMLLTAALLLAAASANAEKQKKGGAATPDSCGYPNGAAPALSSVVFSESDTLQAFSSNSVSAGGSIKAWYTDEHALTLGVRQAIVKTALGTTITDYSANFTAFNSATLSALNPGVGTTALTGAQAGTDYATHSSTYGFLDHGRPMWPALFITDITIYPNSTLGDWQQTGGTPIPPNAIYGTWKGAVRTVDQTRTPPLVTITPDADPARNFWNGIPDAPPGGFGSNAGFGAELVWNVNALSLIPSHTYRMQFMLHDGDQNKAGGDSGEACVVVLATTGGIIG